MKSDHDNNDSKHQVRRSTLKTLLVGGGTLTLSALPSQWTKPMVDAVMLPSHAQTTEPEPEARNGFSVALETRAPGLLNRIIPTAHASTVVAPTSGSLCIESTETGWAASFDTGTTVLTGTGSIGSCATLSCGESPVAIDLRVTAANSNGSFDFELYEPFLGCSDGPIVSNTTNEPCSLRSCEESQTIGP